MRRVKTTIPLSGHSSEPIEIIEGETKLRLLPIETKIDNFKLVLEKDDGNINQIGIYKTIDFNFIFQKEFVKFYFFWETTETEYHLEVEIS